MACGSRHAERQCAATLSLKLYIIFLPERRRFSGLAACIWQTALSLFLSHSANISIPVNNLIMLCTTFQPQGQGIPFAPACIGTPFDAETKLHYLREVLEDESLALEHKNIEFLIQCYEN